MLDFVDVEVSVQTCLDFRYLQQCSEFLAQVLLVVDVAPNRFLCFHTLAGNVIGRKV